MSSNGHIMNRRITILVIAFAFVVAACGATNESSGRNLTRNSVLCYQTQAEKDAVLADAENAVKEAQPPILSDASSAGIGQLAFIGPVQWWKRLPGAAATTTTVAATTTTVEPAARSLNAPTNVQATADGTSVSVSWTASEATDTDVEWYALAWSTDGLHWSSSAVNDTSATFSNFQPGETVQFTVRATNGTYRVYSILSAGASATIPGQTSEETTTTVADTQSSDGESTTSLPLISESGLADLQAQVNLIKETPLCVDLDAAATVECSVQAGFDIANSEIASIVTCADADAVRVQFAGSTHEEGILGGNTVTMDVGSVDSYVFQLTKAGVVIASGTVQHGETQSFTGIDQASLVTPTNEVVSGTLDTVKCDATAGLDLNSNLAYVDPCADATYVRFAFEGSQVTSTVEVSSGQRASVVNNDRVGFTFEVYVGEVRAVSGSVAYPWAPLMITSQEECAVSVTDAGANIVVRGCDRITRVNMVAYNAEINASWTNSWNLNGFGLRKWVAGSRYDFEFVAGEQVVASIRVTDGGSSTSEGTVDVEIYADVNEDFSGSIQPPVNDDNGGSGILEPREGYIVCTALASVTRASFSCSRPLVVYFNSAFEQSITHLYGNQETIFGPLENVDNSQILVSSEATDEILIRVGSSQGTLGLAETEYQFYVPDLDTPVVDFGDNEEDWPSFAGVITPDFPNDTTTSFTIPEDYSASGFYLQFYGLCEAGTFQAVLKLDDETVASFVNPGESNYSVGYCGVVLNDEGEIDAGFLGKTFEVVLSSTEPHSGDISWSGSVEIQGGGAASFGNNTNMSSVEWGDPTVSTVNAPQTYQIEIPAGGKFFEIRGNSGQFEELDCPDYVDPYLKLYNSNGGQINEDDDDGELDGGGVLSSLLSGFLPEGTYTLVATTWDFETESDCANAQTTYQLAMRFGTRITLAPDTVAVANPTDVTTTTTTSTTVPVTTVPDAVPTDNQPVVTPLAKAPTNLQPDPAPVALPVMDLVRKTQEEVSTGDPAPALIGIPAGVNELLCNEVCVGQLLEQAGVEDGTIEIAVGKQVTVIDTLKHSGTVAVRPGARKIVVTVTPSDGSTPVVLTRDIVVLSALVVPTKVSDTATKYISKSTEKSGLPWWWLVLAILLASAFVTFVRNRRRLPQS